MAAASSTIIASTAAVSPPTLSAASRPCTTPPASALPCRAPSPSPSLCEPSAAPPAGAFIGTSTPGRHMRRRLDDSTSASARVRCEFQCGSHSPRRAGSRRATHPARAVSAVSQCSDMLQWSRGGRRYVWCADLRTAHCGPRQHRRRNDMGSESIRTRHYGSLDRSSAEQ